MKSTIKKIFGYSALMLGSAFVAGVTTYTLMEKNGDSSTVVTVQQDGSFAMPTAICLPIIPPPITHTFLITISITPFR